MNDKNFVGLATDGDYIACGLFSTNRNDNRIFMFLKKWDREWKIVYEFSVSFTDNEWECVGIIKVSDIVSEIKSMIWWYQFINRM